MSPLTSYSKVVQAKKILGSNVDDETILLSIENSKYYGMADTGSEIWMMLEKPSLVTDIVNHLVASYDVEYEQCLEDVLNFLEELLKANLITIK